MISHITERFHQLLADLPKETQRQAREAYAQFKRDPYYPGLHFKRVHSKRPIYKDPSEYRHLKRNYDEAKEILRNKAGDYEETAEELADAKILFNKAHAEREHEFEKLKAKAEEERDIWMSLIQVYMSSNMEARNNKKRPESFNVDPEKLVSLPDEFQRLDCGSCCYEEERK